ncbi:SDR family NAD(P)-dependent oxidoreductase [Kiloniella laminariae]|uniref:SDR family NAD(P)-dependent oxidoreductase n=1 Tax=Kiloniella laminariae TaxID=454162 RepID=A0ABT4LN64_9PROT|nr:SDR family NAD(P)-dependent oxidoreductase [Kiloniella laminariae]MCZ4282527.1 SDR family NAD(P)-dependent oxidoreductase [Kiloniella laminariae]
MNKTKPLAIIAGAGPGLGQAVARKLAQENYRVIGLRRSLPSAERISGVEFAQLDLQDNLATEQTLNTYISRYGPPEILVHNPAKLMIKPFLETTAEDFVMAWKSMVLSAVNVCQVVLPHMLQSGQGNIIISGATASLRGGKNFAAFASAKFALRGLAQSLAREYQQQGIHVAHVILDGIINTEASRSLHKLASERMMSPDDIAKIYWQLIQQPRSTWSHEVDVRPQQETF